ncbi:MAG: mechanosensitive ion channel family protein [Acidobacteria bacterium]|nr:mechanosensitive ion channel family protein [Acidobacteriota bacterium]
MTYAVVGLTAAVLILMARASRLELLSRLSGALGLVMVAGIANWAGTFFEIPPRVSSWLLAALVLALGLLLARAAILVLFEWLLGQRLGFRVPRLARDVVAILLYLLVAAIVLKAVLGIEVQALIATSAVITVVIGLALQETLGTLLAGLTLAWEQHLQAGAWIELDGVVGRIEELGWRSLLLRTPLGDRRLIPNSAVARAGVRLLGRGELPTAVPVRLGVSYNASPDRVKAALGAVARDVPGVLVEPAPQVLVTEFADSAILYECRLWTRTPWQAYDVRDRMLTRAYAALGRAGMEIPFPQRTLHMSRRTPPPDTVGMCERALASAAIFSGLPESALARLAAHSRWLRFVPGEAIVTEGDASRALYVIAEGQAVVRRQRRELGRVGAGEVFGEIAFLTGQPRTATVRASTELHVVEVDSVALSALLEENADLADVLAERVAGRQTVQAAEQRGEPTTAEGGVLSQLRLRLRRLVGGGPRTEDPSSLSLDDDPEH